MNEAASALGRMVGNLRSVLVDALISSLILAVLVAVAVEFLKLPGRGFLYRSTIRRWLRGLLNSTDLDDLAQSRKLVKDRVIEPKKIWDQLYSQTSQGQQSGQFHTSGESKFPARGVGCVLFSS
jgi:hypothetical protein